MRLGQGAWTMFALKGIPGKIFRGRSLNLSLCSVIATATCLSVFWRNDDQILEFQCNTSSRVSLAIDYTDPPVPLGRQGLLAAPGLTPGAVLEMDIQPDPGADVFHPIYQLRAASEQL